MSAHAPDRSRAAGTPRVTMAGTAANGLRRDLAVIADWIAPGAHVLDLGCGDGALLDHLQRAKRCTGYGVEIADAQVLACARRGVDVIQQDIEAGLDIFAGSRFDVVVLSMAIQATHETERVLREMSRLGTEGIASFPNFGHWSHAWSILKGRMPVSREMPYQWYDTPNLHLSTLKDFEDFLERLGLAITRPRVPRRRQARRRARGGCAARRRSTGSGCAEAAGRAGRPRGDARQRRPRVARLATIRRGAPAAAQLLHQRGFCA